MRRSGRRYVTLAAISAVTAVFLALTAGGAVARIRTRTWQLVDYHQSRCFDNTSVKYYGVYIEGRWRQPLDVGISNLPSGGTFTTLYAPIPPGSSTGEYSLAYVGVSLPSATPLGTYTASLWAGNARGTSSVPVTLVVETNCGY
jgi:hypothetical protein